LHCISFPVWCQSDPDTGGSGKPVPSAPEKGTKICGSFSGEIPDPLKTIPFQQNLIIMIKKLCLTFHSRDQGIITKTSARSVKKWRKTLYPTGIKPPRKSIIRG
jgi:hypothetical protein